MKKSQRDYLREVKSSLKTRHPDLTWDGLAKMLDVEPRALKTYRMPETSGDYRTMPRLVRNAIEALLGKDGLGSKKPGCASRPGEEV